MESQALHARFHQFCNLVHLFMDINLVLVNRKLIPERESWEGRPWGAEKGREAELLL